MKLSLFATMMLGASLLARGAEGDANTNTNVSSELKDKKDRTSYALGMNMGANLKKQGVEVNPDLLLRGLRDAMQTDKTLLTEEQMRETFKELQTEMQAKYQQRRTEQLGKNKTEGEKFLAENKSKEGVVALPDGLQYKVIKEGDGPSPKASDQVSVKYTGKLINGTVFDSSDKHGGQPAKFRVDGVIKGWTEALQKMKKGSHWELYIPSDLAYGERGSGAQIEPNSTLIFDVELVDITPADKPPTPGEPVTSDIIKVPSAEELKKGAKIEVLKPEDVKREIERQKSEQQKQGAAPKK
jgi:FKBP-type peptidyl-prolyl cis-trans isomerase FklB